MKKSVFEKIVAEEFLNLPPRCRAALKNVAVVVESEPSAELRRLHNLAEDETLLGHYHGVPHTERGESYGVGATLPDVVHLFQIPIEEEAAGEEVLLRCIIRETLWHEFAHHMGMDEGEVSAREDARDKSA